MVKLAHGLLWSAAAGVAIGACTGIAGLSDLQYVGFGGAGGVAMGGAGGGGAMGGAGGGGGAEAHCPALRGSSFGDTGEIQLLLLETDGAGNIYLYGSLDGEADLGGGTLTGTGDRFVAKLGPTGAFAWNALVSNQVATLPGPFTVSAIAPTPDGALLVTGTYQLTVDFGSGPSTAAGGQDVFVARFDDTGSVWTTSIGTASSEYVQDMAVDPTGNIWLVGRYTTNPIQVGGTPIGDPTQMFVLRLDSDGSPTWGDAPGDGLVDPERIAVSEFGFALTGGLLGDATFGSHVALLPATATDGGTYIAVADPSGTYLWAGGYGEGGTMTSRAIDLTGTGALAFAGALNGAIRLGDENDGAELLGAVQSDGLIGRLDSTGTHLFSALYGGVLDQTADHITHSDGESSVLVSGSVQGSIDLGGGELEVAGQQGAYVAKLGWTGDHICSYGYADDAIIDSFLSAPQPDGGFVVAGSYAGQLSPGAGVELQSASTRNVFVIWYGP